MTEEFSQIILTMKSKLAQKAEAILLPPLLPPTGNDLQESLFSSTRFSFTYGQIIEEALAQHPLWEKAHPILLGSWARGELCPKSDLDVIFCGDEKTVFELVQDLEKHSLKLRYRLPQDMNDWTAGVQSFDVLALMRARPLTGFAAEKLFEQQKLIVKNGRHFQKQLLLDIKKEKVLRAQRFDSISNFLEPNLKYGAGALRDIDQGLQIYDLFGLKFEKADYALRVLRFYKSYLLNLRQKLHASSYADVLVGPAQFDLAQWCGFSSQKEFMKSIQRGLSRAHFYAEWILEMALSSEAKIQKYHVKSYKTEKDLWLGLKKDPTILNQKIVRDSLDICFKATKDSSRSALLRGKILKEFVGLGVSDEVIQAVFQSRMMDRLIPEFTRLVGWVQHDQYHRYPADTHIMQARRELRRLAKKPKLLGVLQSYHKKLSVKDWEILGWTSLYHDLAKGLDGDHSEKGVALARKDLKSFGVSDDIIEEVCWMVLNHLELSSAAFRKNPHDPALWKYLKDKAVTGGRLYRLAIFTVVDIRATNSEAWNDWKAQLLRDLIRHLESENAQALYELDFAAKKYRLELPMSWIEQMDPLLVSSFGARFLVKDLAKLSGSKEARLDVFEDNHGRRWVRFYNPKDEKGLLRDYVFKLFGMGLAIRHASVHTFESFGVWDFFMVANTKSKEVLKKQLELAPTKTPHFESIQFQDIQWVEVSEQIWILSFRAIDQSGLLACAVNVLTDLSLNIIGAKVHTWGRQVDDVFAIRPQGDPQVLLSEIRSRVKIKKTME